MAYTPCGVGREPLLKMFLNGDRLLMLNRDGNRGKHGGMLMQLRVIYIGTIPEVAMGLLAACPSFHKE